MRTRKVKSIPIEEIAEAVRESETVQDVSVYLGYPAKGLGGRTRKKLYQIILDAGIDVTHLHWTPGLHDHLVSPGEKICTSCKETKSVDEFTKDTRNADGLAGWCRDCANEHRAEYYASTSERHRANSFERRKPFYKLMYDCLSDRPCTICGDTNLQHLEFHHVNSDEKDFDVSLGGRHMNLDIVMNEILKCVVCCRNCHKTIHSSKKYLLYRENPQLAAETITPDAVFEHLEYIDAYFKDHPCCICGSADVTSLQFHHREDTVKRCSVTNLVYGGCTMDTLIEEIVKCDVYCANCHIDITGDHLSVQWYEKQKGRN